MLKTLLLAVLPALVFFGNTSDYIFPSSVGKGDTSDTGQLQKMIVANGTVSLDLNLGRLNGSRPRSKNVTTALRFDVEPDSFFKILVFNDELRGPAPGTMALVPQTTQSLPEKLSASYNQLVIENGPWGGPFDLIIRDAKTGFVFFNVEGSEYTYEPNGKVFGVKAGRLLISPEFAAELGRPRDGGVVIGEINVSATMQPIEITDIVDGEVKSTSMPAVADPEAGTVPGPDVIVGDLNGLAQFGSSQGTQVGLAVGTDSCNFGTTNLNWFALPNNDHPVIPQNMYRMSGGAANDERFEQIGQSNVKHAFTALTENLCNLGCNGVGGSQLGSGCSDPYVASLNAGPGLGSRAWINPFTGAFPRGDSATPPNNHSGHSHTGPAHKILTEINDLLPSANPGATYFAEAQYITPHEYAWCQSNPGQCNMYNNVSYRQYSVFGSGSPFSFSPVSSTVRTKAAVRAWTGAAFAEFNPAPGADGVGTVAYKVTNPSPGLWRYEYAVYNQNLDRAIQSFSIPLSSGVTISNIGFHAPPQQPGWTFDGTVGNTGFSNLPWTQTQTASAMTWSSETLAENQNANAIRWGTMYNFRFESNRPPQSGNATVGFFKTGAPITVPVQVPSGAVAAAFSVSGRILTAGGQGISRAIVTLTDSSGNSRTAISSSFGYYRFDNVPSGATYTITVTSKRYTFSSQTVTVNDNVAGVDFVAQPVS